MGDGLVMKGRALFGGNFSISGGIGINPMLSMLAEAAEHRTPRNYHLVYSGILSPCYSGDLTTIGLLGFSKFFHEH